MNNSVFGKAMENIKNNMKLILTTDNERAIKRLSQLELKYSRVVYGLHMVEMLKQYITNDQPITIGTNFYM